LLNPYKYSGGAMVPSELGDIPEGWRVGTLEDVITQANTGADAIQKAPIVNENTGIKCLRIGDITNHRQFEEWGYCKVTKKHFLQYQLKKGDILVTRTSALGLNILLLKDLSTVFNNGLIKIRIKDEINTVFIYSFMQSKRYKEYIARITYETTTRPNMQINYLLDFPLLFVNKDLEDNFSSFALKILLKQDKNNEQIQTLTKIRDSLLPKLMSGQIRVKE
jgi:type I restriction enzyme S subunit